MEVYNPNPTKKQKEKFNYINNACDCKIVSFYLSKFEHQNLSSKELDNMLMDSLSDDIKFFLKVQGVSLILWGFSIQLRKDSKIYDFKKDFEEINSYFSFDILNSIYSSLEKIANPITHKYLFLNKEKADIVKKKLTPELICNIYRKRGNNFNVPNIR
jgi:hypothetical protein